MVLQCVLVDLDHLGQHLVISTIAGPRGIASFTAVMFFIHQVVLGSEGHQVKHSKLVQVLTQSVCSTHNCDTAGKSESAAHQKKNDCEYKACGSGKDSMTA